MVSPPTIWWATASSMARAGSYWPPASEAYTNACQALACSAVVIVGQVAAANWSDELLMAATLLGRGGAVWDAAYFGGHSPPGGYRGWMPRGGMTGWA